MNQISDNMICIPQAGIPSKRRVKYLKNQQNIAQIILHLIAAFETEIRASGNVESEKQKLLWEIKSVSAGIMNLYQSNPDEFSMSAIRARARVVERALKKNQREKERYNNDEGFRQRKKEQMRQWRNNPENAAREKAAAIRRRDAPPKTKFEI